MLLFLSLACRLFSGSSPPPPSGTIPVDPIFSNFYTSLGGEEVLGPPISPLFSSGEKLYQYTLAALMVFDPQAVETEQRHLAPLGLDMGLNDLPVPPPEGQASLYINGHVIFDDFIPLYNRLGGLTFAGRPLTEVRHNLEKRRFEQYFENVGMYRMENAPPQEVHLLAYGAWKCQQYCTAPPYDDAMVILPSFSADPFIRTVMRLGSDFTGFALTVPNLASDGHIEQIFENVVMVASPNAAEGVSLRPLPVRLGIDPEPLEQPSADPNFSFFEIEPGRGYNIPNQFLDYIANHGGLDITGVPIGRYVHLGNGLARQCFTNVCLEEHQDLPPGQRVRPSPLGYTYREINYHTETAGQGMPPVIQMELWESWQGTGEAQVQEIGVTVLSDGEPLPNLTPMLVLSLPDGEQRTYFLPALDENGQSRMLLQPLPVKNGSLVPYQICLTPDVQNEYCVRDRILIWGGTALPKESRIHMPLILRFFTDNKERLYLPLTFR